MKFCPSTSAHASASSVFSGGRARAVFAFLTSTALAVSPAIFCSCESAGGARGGNNPYAQNDPQTPEEEAYYRDVYSGDWRQQSNPFGTGPSVCKRSGSTKLPEHWTTRPAGAKDLTQVRAESAARRSASSMAYAQAPTSGAYGAPAASAYPPAATMVAQNVPQAQYAAPTAPQAQAQYAAPAATMVAQNVPQAQYAAPAAPQAVAPQAQYAAPAAPQVVGPQPVQVPGADLYAAPQGPAEYPAPSYQGYQGAALNRASAWIVRGQEPAAEAPAVEAKAENVQAKVAPGAGAAEGPSTRVGGKAKPLQIDPAIAAPYADVNRPLANPAAPANPDGARASQSEYVVSGGDSKGAAYSKEDWTVENLDVEDSAAHFDSIDGRILMEPSNKVFIYSPRFGSVRQIVGSVEGDVRTFIAGAETIDSPNAADVASGIDVREQASKPLGATNTQAAAGANSQAGAASASGRIGVIEGTALARLGAMLTADSVDGLSSKDSTLLLQAGMAAQSWAGEQKVAVALEQVNAFSNIYVSGAETIFAVKDDTKTSKLRLIKIANKDSARPGELVEFTLRFENIGDEPI
ncbi:MAG: hypothetical protein HUK22_03485, partial [Thermoguttaceae bacterium]|nr:hypothetical protein [Thermoguttaceae bacterium]